jgi:hypothetical protein
VSFGVSGLVRVLQTLFKFRTLTVSIGKLFYNLKNVTVFTDDYGQVKLFIQVAHRFMYVTANEYHLELIPVNPVL